MPIAKLYSTWAQPPFKHWFKVYVEGRNYDIYFKDDNPQLVVVGGIEIAVDPIAHRNILIRVQGVEIYHTSSK